MLDGSSRRLQLQRVRHQRPRGAGDQVALVEGVVRLHQRTGIGLRNGVIRATVDALLRSANRLLAGLRDVLVVGVHKALQGGLEEARIVDLAHQFPGGHGHQRPIHGEGELAAQAGGHVVAHVEAFLPALVVQTLLRRGQRALGNRQHRVHNGAGVLHYESQHGDGVGRDVVERAHGRRIGQLGGDSGARSVEAQGSAGHHLAARLLLLGEEIAGPLDRRLPLPQIDPEQQAGALAVRLGDARIQGRRLEAGIELRGGRFHRTALRPEQQHAAAIQYRQRDALLVQELLETFALLLR